MATLAFHPPHALYYPHHEAAQLSLSLSLDSSRHKRLAQRGFTIVELLIVIVVIAILAAITIVAYNGIQDRANQAALASDFEHLSKKLELYAVDNGTYPSLSNTALLAADLGFTPTKSLYAVNTQVTRNLVVCMPSDLSSFAILAKLKNGQAYIQRKGQALSTYAVTWTTGTAAGTLCSGAGYTTGSASGYWYEPSSNAYGWQAWTGS